MACGVAVVVTDEKRVLFGKRAGGLSDFEWQLPGGWIEPGESPLQAARREVLEETGLELRDPILVGLSSNVFSQGGHSISLYFEAECEQPGQLVLRETGACLGWEWKSWSEINENLYLPLRLFKQTDYRPFSIDPGRAHVSF